MKYVIALRHIQSDPRCDMMLNIAFQYGLMYQEYNNDMLFFLKDDFSDEKTAYFFGGLLCHIFATDYSDTRYKYPDFKPNIEAGIYDILFAFIDCVRKSTDEKHYKEKLRKTFAGMNAQMKENLPALYLLKDNSYSLLPYCKTKKEKVVRNKSRRATYRNFNWESLCESCLLYRDFIEGRIEDTGQIYHLARGMCGAEKGRNKFLEIMGSEENSNKHYRLLHWKEILTAIIKDDVPVPLCDSCEYCDSCSHSENMLSTVKPSKREIRVLQKEKFTNIDTAYMDLQNAFQRAAESQDNRIYIIKGQTALGKTSTYIEYMKKSSRPVVIAVPTHELKEQIIRDARVCGVNDICGTPDINTYGISSEIIDEMNDIYRIGAGEYALRILADKLNSLDRNDSDYDNISRYLKDCKSSVRYQGHIITTHAKLLHLPQTVLDSHDVIIDEDILRTVLRTESIEIREVKNVINSDNIPYHIKTRLNGICMKRGCHTMDSFDIPPDDKQKFLNVNIYGLLKSKYISVSNGKITFLIEEKLPDCKLIILSATVSCELYRKIYTDRDIDYHECPKAKYKGKIIQFTDSSYSRYALKNDSFKLKILKDFCKDTEVITFKEIEKEFNTRYHFGNVEGINNLKGKDLSVIGLPNLDESVYFLYAMRAGTVIGKEYMRPQRIIFGNKSFYLNTYKNETLQMIQTWFLSSQLEQAVGRARLLREECTVIVFAGFPVEQAEYSDKLYSKEF